MNIKPFLSGDRVYYVGTLNDLPKNTILIVNDCITTECCGKWLVEIKGYAGRYSDGTPYVVGEVCICSTCKRATTTKSILAAKIPSVFRPAQEINAPLMTFTKVAEVEKEEVLILN